jgi:hypothetical protein
MNSAITRARIKRLRFLAIIYFSDKAASGMRSEQQRNVTSVITLKRGILKQKTTDYVKRFESIPISVSNTER